MLLFMFLLEHIIVQMFLWENIDRRIMPLRTMSVNLFIVPGSFPRKIKWECNQFSCGLYKKGYPRVFLLQLHK